MLTDEDFGYPTPEEAARGDIPPDACRVVLSDGGEDHAWVRLQVSTNPPYFDLNYCERVPNGWVAVTSSGHYEGL
jgi:hypothetical protein